MRIERTLRVLDRLLLDLNDIPFPKTVHQFTDLFKETYKPYIESIKFLHSVSNLKEKRIEHYFIVIFKNEKNETACFLSDKLYGKVIYDKENF